MTFSYSNQNKCIKANPSSASDIILFNPDLDTLIKQKKEPPIVLSPAIEDVAIIESLYNNLGNRFIKNPGEYEVGGITIKSKWIDSANGLAFYVRDNKVGVMFLSSMPNQEEFIKVLGDIGSIDILVIQIDDLAGENIEKMLDTVRVTESGLLILRSDNYSESQLNQLKTNFSDTQIADKYNVKKSDIDPLQVKLVVLG